MDPAVQDAIRATAPIAAAARSVTTRLTRSSCAPEGCLRKTAGRTGTLERQWKGGLYAGSFQAKPKPIKTMTGAMTSM